MQCFSVSKIAAFAVSNWHSKQRPFGRAVSEWRIRNFYPKRDHLADKTKRAVPHERAREQAGFAQNLETVARAEHEFSCPRVADYRLHDRRETRDRTTAQIVAVSEPARQNDRIVIAQRHFFVPDVISL